MRFNSNPPGAGMWEDSGVPGDDARMAMVVVGTSWGLTVRTLLQALKKYFNILITVCPYCTYS